MEQLDYNLLYRWFVRLLSAAPSSDAVLKDDDRIDKYVKRIEMCTRGRDHEAEFALPSG